MYLYMFVSGEERIPFESTILHMLAQLILPLLQQVGRHDNQGGLDGNSLPFIMFMLLQVLDRPRSRRGVGQDEHQTLKGFAQALQLAGRQPEVTQC